MPRLDDKLYELWEGFENGQAILQTPCDEPGCDKGLIYSPVRNCPRCGGAGYLTRRIYLQECPHKDCIECDDDDEPRGSLTFQDLGIDPMDPEQFDWVTFTVKGEAAKKLLDSDDMEPRP